MVWYQFIDDKLQGNNLNGQNIIGTIASVNLHWQNMVLPVNNVDIVGGVIQSWLSAWFYQENIHHIPNPATQAWPDFWIPITILPNQLVNFPIEVKSFKKGAGPAFDISDFHLYVKSLSNNPIKLDSIYLIFEYEVLMTGIRLTRYWWKNVWEIVGNSNGLVTLQTRKRTEGDIVPNNLRPYTFYSNRAGCLPIISRLNFVQLLDATCKHYDPTHDINWAQDVSNKYSILTNQPL